MRDVRSARRAGDRARGPRDDRRADHRADPHVGRRRDPAGRLSPRAAGALRHARHRARLRRDHHRLRPHRPPLRRRALLEPGRTSSSSARASPAATSPCPRRSSPTGSRRPSGAQPGSEFAAGHTYAGNPVACAVGLATLQELRELDLVANAAARGEQALERLRSLQARAPGNRRRPRAGSPARARVRARPRHEGVVPRPPRTSASRSVRRLAGRGCSCARATGWRCSRRR